MSTPAPEDGAQTTQLRNTIIIGVSVAAGLAVLVAVIAFCYRRHVRREDERRKEEKEAAQSKRRDRYELPGRVEHVEPEEAYCDEEEFTEVRHPRPARTRRGDTIQEELRDINSAVRGPRAASAGRGARASSGGRARNHHAVQMIRSGAVAKEKEEDYEYYEEPAHSPAGPSPSMPRGQVPPGTRTKASAPTGNQQYSPADRDHE